MWLLAWRHLIARKRQTILTLIGILLGTAGYVVISGFMLGFREYFVDQLVNNDAQVRISAREDLLTAHSLDHAFFPSLSGVIWRVSPSGRKSDPKIDNPEGWYRRLDADRRIAAYSPQLTTQVIVSKAGTSTSVRLLGVQSKSQAKVTNIARYVTKGDFMGLASGGNRLVVGDELLQKLGARYHETIWISNGKSPAVPFKIVGVFHAGVKVLDEGTVFGALSDAQKINGTPNQINEIAIKLVDLSQAASLATAWSLSSKDRVESWDQINQNLLEVFKIQDRTRYMMTMAIVLVASFGIYNILNMVVSQKRKEIAILRTMGYESFDVIKLFLIQGVALGVTGGFLGVVVGYGFCWYLSTLPFVGGTMGTGPGRMSVSFDPMIYVIGFFMSVIVSIFASALPARLAGRMSPIDIIRSES